MSSSPKACLALATLTLLGLAAALPQSAHAQTRAFTITAPGGDYRNFTANPNTGAAGFGPITVGDRFTAADPFVVTSLGYYDPFGVNLTAGHQVGLFLITTDPVGGTEIATQVAGATVAPSDALSADDFRFAAITPTPLLPGTYDLAGFTNGDAATFSTDAYFLANSTFTPASGFTLTAARANFAGAFAAPNLTTGDTSYFGPNFQVLATPEPSTCAGLALGLLGLSGLALRASRRN